MSLASKAAVVLAVLAVPGAAQAATPPAAPPTSGPGGTDYQWSGATVTSRTFTDATHNYTTYVPSGWTGGGSAPATAPVVVFLHGANATDPSSYATWLGHLARKGNIVVFPVYQRTLTMPSKYTDNAMWAIRDALSRLQANAAVKPSTANGIVVMGHSYGGVVAPNYANRAASAGLPRAAAILAVEPWFDNIDSSLSGIPSTTKLDCVVGDADQFAGRSGCDTIWSRTGHIPAANRNYVWAFGDAHGSPALSADHIYPADQGGTANALDWYADWKLGDGLRDCALLGTNCAYALGGGTQQRFMGTWSDGVPVRQLGVSTTPPPCPAGSQARGC